MTYGHYRHPKKPSLKKSLGLFETTFYGVGLILGAGIYVLLGRGAAIAGNSIWLAFVVAAIMAAFTGLSYCELSSRIPKASSEYLYSKKAFSSKAFSFLIGWILIFAGAVSATAVALGFGEYFAALFSLDFSLTPFIAAALLVVLTAINFWGIKESAWIDVLFSFVEMGGLILIIFIGIPYFGSVNYFTTPTGTFFTDFGSIMAAASLIFFAFIGFGEMTKIIEETKNGRRTIPKALIYALIISTILYVLVAISAVSVVPWNMLDKAPLSSIVGMVWGQNGLLLMSVIALFATFNTALAIMVGFSRLIYGMADIRVLPSKLSKIHASRKTPYYSIFLLMLISLAFILLGDISVLASVTDFGIFVVYLVVNIALIALRYIDRNKKKTDYFRVPFNIGWFPLTALIGIFTVIAMMLHFELMIYIYELGIIAIGLVIYGILKALKHTK